MRLAEKLDWKGLKCHIFPIFFCECNFHSYYSFLTRRAARCLHAQFACSNVNIAKFGLRQFYIKRSTCLCISCI
jgi:hypothetical protein